MANKTVLRGTFQADRLESVNPIELVGLSPFDELRTASRANKIDLKPTFGLSALRDIVTTTGSGTVTSTIGSSEYRLATTASGTDKAILSSAERGQYISGTIGEPGQGVRISATPTGNQVVLWGYYDDNNGFGFGLDADGLFIFVRKDGADEVIRQADWNNDKLDGTGPSKLDLDVSVGQIFQFPFVYYGHGPISFEVAINDSDNRQRKILVHRFKRDGAVSVSVPNLPIRAEIDNAGTATAFDGVYIAGRQYSTVGDYSPNRRFTCERRLSLGSVGTTLVPLVTFRRKAAYESVSVKLSGMDLITDGDLVFEVLLNATLTGATYGTPTGYTASETAVEADVAATAISGGEVLFCGIVDAGQGSASGSQSISDLGFDFAGLQPVTLAVRTISGTATVSSVLRAREEW